MPKTPATLIAVDVGNSQIKLGRFDRTGQTSDVPAPLETLELGLVNRAGDFDSRRLADWCAANVSGDAIWRVASVHRGATEQLIAAGAKAKPTGRKWEMQQIAHADVPLTIEVDYPDRVGIDRLLTAVAMNKLRTPGRPAVAADLGTAITVDLMTANGAFAGGAILPGLAMSAQALEEQTDALPRVAVDQWSVPPYVVGKSTVPAIESGLFWGAVGAIRELVVRYTAEVGEQPDFFITGGAAPLVAQALASTSDLPVRHLPHLVLSGIAIVDQAVEA